MGLTETIRRVAPKLTPLLLAATLTCTDRATTAPSQPKVTPPPPQPTTVTRLTELHLPTPDGSYNLLHPSVRCNEYYCLLFACEHTLRDPKGERSLILENTVAYKSTGLDMLSWTSLGVIMNADDIDSTTDFSDPNQLQLETKTVAYSRLVPKNFDVILARESADTVHWGPYKEVLRVPTNAAIAPSVLQTGPAEFSMWYTDASPIGCDSWKTLTLRRRSSIYDDFNSAVVDTTDLNENSVPGMVPWHTEFLNGPKNRPDSTIVLSAMHPPGTACGTSSVYIGTTIDGKHITMNPGAVLAAGQDTTFTIVYKSGGQYFPQTGTFRIIFSGMKTNGRPEARLAERDYNLDSLLASTRQGRTPAPNASALFQFTLQKANDPSLRPPN